MLLFIDTTKQGFEALGSFNTSHVTLYRKSEMGELQYTATFQYISCYSLSVKTPLNAVINLGFNTSHVTLYPVSRASRIFSQSFQYISCYSLSCVRAVWLTGHAVFQYISCYSLSASCCRSPKPAACFNTSHVTLYHLRRTP